MKDYSGKMLAEGVALGIAVSRFNSFFTRQLLAGALDCVERLGGSEKNVTVAWAPGANDLPLLVQRMANMESIQAVVALGAVIEGATPHADLINSQLSRSLTRIALESGRPVVNGVVCTHTIEQAVERSGTKAGNKGADAVQAAIEMVSLLGQLPPAKPR